MNFTDSFLCLYILREFHVHVKIDDGLSKSEEKLDSPHVLYYYYKQEDNQPDGELDQNRREVLEKPEA